jgi:hypothetical protein
MIASVDGRIGTGGWPLSAEGRRQYELVHASYEPDGRIGTSALFDGDDVAPRRLALNHVERRADDVLWLRYRVEGGTT